MGAAYNRVKEKLRGLMLRAWAVGPFVPLSGTQGSSVELAPFLTQAMGASGSGLVPLFNAAFRMAIAIGAILAVLRIVYAGFIYMTTDLFAAKSNAKEILFNAVLGLFLLLGIWLILNQINPRILDLQLFQGQSRSGYDAVGTPNNTGGGLGPR